MIVRGCTCDVDFHMVCFQLYEHTKQFFGYILRCITSKKVASALDAYMLLYRRLVPQI